MMNARNDWRDHRKFLEEFSGLCEEGNNFAAVLTGLAHVVRDIGDQVFEKLEPRGVLGERRAAILEVFKKMTSDPVFTDEIAQILFEKPKPDTPTFEVGARVVTLCDGAVPGEAAFLSGAIGCVTCTHKNGTVFVRFPMGQASILAHGRHHAVPVACNPDQLELIPAEPEPEKPPFGVGDCVWNPCSRVVYKVVTREEADAHRDGWAPVPRESEIVPLHCIWLRSRTQPGVYTWDWAKNLELVCKAN